LSVIFYVDYSCGDSSGITPAFPFNLPSVVSKGKNLNPEANLDEKAQSTKPDRTKVKIISCRLL
jgi:hypothetical protein